MFQSLAAGKFRAYLPFPYGTFHHFYVLNVQETFKPLKSPFQDAHNYPISIMANRKSKKVGLSQKKVVFVQ
jgi:hypothetical protein